MHNEFEFLRRFFVSNGFPSGLIYSQIRKFLCNREHPSTTSGPQETAELLYIYVPYFGYQSEKLKKGLLY